MNRRTVLATTGCVLSLPLAGCFGDGTDDGEPPDGDEDNPRSDDDQGSSGADDGDEDEQWYAWHYAVGGRIDTVAGGRVYGVEHSDDEGDGGVYALDVETGEHRWTYGQSDDSTAYSPVTAGDDAVYFGSGEDASGSESGSLIAVTTDGETLWERSIGTVSRRPRLGDDLVVTGSDDGTVHAFGRESGEHQWTTDDLPGENVTEPTVVGVDDAVYVNAGPLVALDPGDGEERWRYGESADEVDTVLVDGETIVLNTASWIAVLDRDTERWREAIDHDRFVGVAAGNVIVRSEDQLQAFEGETGNEAWSSPRLDAGDDAGIAVAVHDDRVYAVGDTLHAFDATDGTERWEADLEDERAADSGRVLTADRHGVLVRTSATRLAQFTPTGELTWRTTLNDEEIVDHYRGGRVLVATTEGIYGVPLYDTDSPPSCCR